MPRENPKTCREAAAFFRQSADNCPYPQQKARNLGRAEMLEFFGDAPVPEKLLQDYDFSR
jgi:hypothetical protein